MTDETGGITLIRPHDTLQNGNIADRRHEFSGPARRSEFWYWALFQIVIGVIAWLLDGPSAKAVSAAPTQPGPAPAPV